MSSFLKRTGIARMALLPAALLAGLCWFAGCAVEKNAVIAPREGPVVTAKAERGITDESLKCITCHEERGIAHGWVADWEGSAHARKGVGCEACHVRLALEPAERSAVEAGYLGTDGGNCDDKRVYRKVIAGNCGRCHIKQYNEFMKSRHSIGWQGMTACADRMELSREIRSEKCGQCHNIQFKCDSCHTRHSFSTLEAKTPEACRTCHTGSDHPHFETYISSKHGSVYTASQSGILKDFQSVQSLRSPVCVTCHMPQGGHDISFGLACGPVGSEMSYVNRDGVRVDEKELAGRRNAMKSVCNACHSSNFSDKALSAADTLHKNAETAVREARGIMSGLEKEGLIYPPTKGLADVPFPGHAIILGNAELTTDKSRIERIFYQLVAGAAIAWKGAYHINPNYAHLTGWAELQGSMSDMREEARRLREDAELRRKMEIRLR